MAESGRTYWLPTRLNIARSDAYILLRWRSRWVGFYQSDPKSINARLLSVIDGSCLSRFKKSKPILVSPIRKTQVPDTKLRFSFEFFDQTDGEMCPANFKAGYTQTLMARLKDISSWTVNRFCGAQDHS